MERIKIVIEFEPYIPKKEYYDEDASIDDMAKIDISGFDFMSEDRNYKLYALILNSKNEVIKRIDSNEDN